MNQTQKYILIAVIVVVVAIFIYPPFQAVRNGTVYNMGYGWIFALSKRGYMTINVSMLIIQWIGVLVVGGIAFFLTKGSSLPSELSSNQNSVATYSTEKMNLTVESYAGFWKRVVAHIVDSVILAIGLFAIILLFGIMFGSGTLDTKAWERMGSFFGLIGCWLYYALMESSSYQGTIGKMFLGIKVTDLNGQPIGFAKASGRSFGMYISAFILFIGFVMVAFTQKKQGLHDIMAGCLVVTRSFESATSNDAAIEKMLREAETRSAEEAQKILTHPKSEVKQQDEEFIKLLKSSIKENKLNTIPGDDLIVIYNRAKLFALNSNELDFELSMAVNALLEEIKKRGLSHLNNTAEIQSLSRIYEKIKDIIVSEVKKTLKTKEEIQILESQSRLPYAELIKLGSPGQLTAEGLSVYELLIKEINEQTKTEHPILFPSREKMHF